MNAVVAKMVACSFPPCICTLTLQLCISPNKGVVYFSTLWTLPDLMICFDLWDHRKWDIRKDLRYTLTLGINLLSWNSWGQHIGGWETMWREIPSFLNVPAKATRFQPAPSDYQVTFEASIGPVKTRWAEIRSAQLSPAQFFNLQNYKLKEWCLL